MKLILICIAFTFLSRIQCTQYSIAIEPFVDLDPPISMKPTAEPSAKPSENVHTSMILSGIQASMEFSGLQSIKHSHNLEPTIEPSAEPTIESTAKHSLSFEYHSLSAIPAPSSPSLEPTSQNTQPNNDLFPTYKPSKTVSTVQPTVRPEKDPDTSKPTSHIPTLISRSPTTVPHTNYPTTAIPTIIPASSAPIAKSSRTPSAIPTIVPTNDMNYKKHFTYLNYMSANHNYSMVENTFSFGNYYFRGSVIDGTCDSWSSFIKNSLSLPFADLYFSKISTYFNTFDFANNAMNTTITSCSDVNVVTQLISNLKLGTDFSATCNGEEWSTFSCEYEPNPLVCVNCRKKDVCAGEESVLQSNSDQCSNNIFEGLFNLNPCTNCYLIDNIAASIFNIGYDFKIFYPEILGPLNVTSKQHSIEVQANVSKVGNLYCAAFLEGIKLENVLDISSAVTSVAAIVESSGLVVLEITGLSPSTEYNVYCYTDNFAIYTMPLKAALATEQKITTKCCRELIVDYAYSSISQYRENSNRAENLFQFSLDSFPVKKIVVQLFIYQKVSCDEADKNKFIIFKSTAQVLPAYFEYNADNLISLQNSFVVRSADVGCFMVKGNTTDGFYQAFEISFKVRDFSAPPDPPSVVSAIFSDDGFSLIVEFDSQTDLGMSVIKNYDAVFTCSQIIEFTDSDITNCVWLNDQKIVADIASSGAQPNVNDVVTFLGNVVMAKYIPDTNKNQYTYASAANVSLAAPLKAQPPEVMLLTSSNIVSCDDLVIDPTVSSGFGGRDWKSVVWSVEASSIVTNIAQVESFLNTNYQGTDQLVTIPNSLITKSTPTSEVSYQISLKLTNFLGSVAKKSVSVIILAPGAVMPTLSLVSDSSVTFRSKSININALAIFPACLKNVSSLPFEYTWKTYKGYSYQSQIKSLSLSPRVYKLDPYTLDASQSYTILVSASIPGSATSVEANTIVQIGREGVQASLKSGLAKTVSSKSEFTLDASTSKDLDYPDGSSLNYLWSCVTFSPTYGQPCTNFHSQNIAELIVPANTMVDNFVYTITILVSNSVGKSDSASMLLTVVSYSIPSIGLDPVSLKYNADAKITLGASVASLQEYEVIADWDCDSINSFNTSGITLTPLQKIVAAEQNVFFPIAISPNSLVPGLQYTFQVIAGYYGSSTASSSVLVTINKPPRGGRFEVKNAADGTIYGIALDSTFSFLAMKWLDDASDLPLTYAFSYSMTAGQQYYVKSPSMTSYKTAILGQGLESSNYSISCFLEVNDIFSGYASVTLSIVVKPPATSDRRYLLGSATIANIESSISTSIANIDIDAVYSTIGASLSSINIVNCSSVPISCATINREGCSSVPNTCGSCNTGYIGMVGNSNSPCILAVNTHAIGSACASNNDCITGECSNHTCVDTLKQCFGDCSGNGSCLFYDVNGHVISTCVSSDSTCNARCSCHANRYGDFCQLDQTSYENSLGFRDFFCSSLYNASLWEDISPTAIKSRASIVANILVDINQISDVALMQCVRVVAEMLSSQPSMSCGAEAYPLIVSALSNTLEIYSSNPIRERFAGITEQIMSIFTGTINQLMTGCQALLSANEAVMNIVGSNFDLLNTLVDSSGAYTDIAIPNTEYQDFNYYPSGSVSVSQAAFDTVALLGIVSYELHKNPHSSTASNSSKIFVHTNSYTKASRRLEANRQLSTKSGLEYMPEVTVVLQNIEPISYYFVESSTLIVNCAANLPTTSQVTCPNIGETFEVTCPAQTTGTLTVTCPGYKTFPTCTIVDAEDSSKYSTCTVLSYDSTSTTCKCKYSSPKRSLLSAPDSSGTATISSETQSKVIDFSTTFTKDNSSNGGNKNTATVIIIVCSVVGFFLLVALGFLLYKYYYLPKYSKVQNASEIEISNASPERPHDSLFKNNKVADYPDLVISPNNNNNTTAIAGFDTNFHPVVPITTSDTHLSPLENGFYYNNQNSNFSLEDNNLIIVTQLYEDQDNNNLNIVAESNEDQDNNNLNIVTELNNDQDNNITEPQSDELKQLQKFLFRRKVASNRTDDDISNITTVLPNENDTELPFENRFYHENHNSNFLHDIDNLNILEQSNKDLELTADEA